MNRRQITNGAITLLVLAIVSLWIGQWQRDGDVLEKILGSPGDYSYETQAPIWGGKGKIKYSDLSRAARSRISRSQFEALWTWAEVCAAFATVPAPTPGTTLNSWISNPIDQGNGVIRPVDVVVIPEWSGWKLAKVYCGPR